ncbi:HAD family phosphatase [Clostridiales bacterium F-3ap]|uniref:HAD family phosphatase n=2 Tax=Anaerotalea alkaliphila TaxID=2662126 RepID=A0A7X5HYC7_9FIRM|nr:HAD family phosphatase [Anaerotalea alkaliphila]
MKTYGLVVFDMDGLMIDSERMTFEGYRAVCGPLGYAVEEEFYTTLLGTPEKTVRRKFVEAFGEGIPIESIMDQMHAWLEERFAREGVPVKPGLVELLAMLKAKGIRTMVATSSKRARVDRILEASGLGDYFDGSICGDEVKRGKPDPEIFLKACAKMGVPPREALVLEDSEQGIQASHRAGIPCICIPDMKRPQPEFVEMTVAVLDSHTAAADWIRKKLC